MVNVGLKGLSQKWESTVPPLATGLFRTQEWQTDGKKVIIGIEIDLKLEKHLRIAKEAKKKISMLTYK